jgi:hypothetical protein
MVDLEEIESRKRTSKIKKELKKAQNKPIIYKTIIIGVIIGFFVILYLHAHLAWIILFPLIGLGVIVPGLDKRMSCIQINCVYKSHTEYNWVYKGRISIPAKDLLIETNKAYYRVYTTRHYDQVKKVLDTLKPGDTITIYLSRLSRYIVSIKKQR